MSQVVASNSRRIEPTNVIILPEKASAMVKSEDELSFIIGTREGLLCRASISNEILKSVKTDLRSIWSIVLDKQGNFYAAGASGVIKHYSGADFTELRILNEHLDEINCLALSSNGQFLFSVSDDKTVRKWDLTADTIVSEVLYEHPGLIYALDVNHDDTILASGCSEKTVLVYSLIEKKEIARLEDAAERVWCVKFSPDSKILVAGVQNSEIIVWENNPWKKIKVLTGHSERVRCVNFSSDGTRLVSGSLDATLKLWNVKNWKEIARLEGHKDWIKSVAFSRDGNTVYSTGDDLTISIWNVKENKCCPFMTTKALIVFGISALIVAAFCFAWGLPKKIPKTK